MIRRASYLYLEEKKRREEKRREEKRRGEGERGREEVRGRRGEDIQC